MRIWVAVAVVASLLAPAAGPARGHDAAPVGGVVVTEAYTYAPGGDEIAGGAAPGSTGPLVIPRGTDLLFANLEATFALDVHTVTSDGCRREDPNPCWFDSGDPEPQAPGDVAIVRTSHLVPGSYGFFCVVHDVMRGTLVIA